MLLLLNACGGSNAPPQPSVVELEITLARNPSSSTCSAPSPDRDGTVFLLCNDGPGANLRRYISKPGQEFGEYLQTMKETWYGLGWSTAHAPSVFFSDDYSLGRVATTSLGESLRRSIAWRYDRNSETGRLENPSPDWAQTDRLAGGEGLAASSDGHFFLWAAKSEDDPIHVVGRGALERPGYSDGSEAAVIFAPQSTDAYIAPARGEPGVFRWSLDVDGPPAHGPRIPLPLPEIGRLATNPEGTLLFAGSDWHEESGLSIEVLQRDPESGELTQGYDRLVVTPAQCEECLDPEADLEWLAIDSRGDVYAATVVPYDYENENPRSGVTTLFRWRREFETWNLDTKRHDIGKEAEPTFRLHAFALDHTPGVLFATAYARYADGSLSAPDIGPFARIEIK